MDRDFEGVPSVMDSSDEELVLALFAAENASLRTRKRKISVLPMNLERTSFGEYHRQMPKLREDPQQFFEYFRMEIGTFDYILKKIEGRLVKKWCNFHRSILPEERLVVTLRFLVTGLSFRVLASAFRMGNSTVAEIVKATTEAIVEELQPVHAPASTTEMLRASAEAFGDAWQFPHAVGCVDAKVIKTVCPKRSSNQQVSYVALQGLVDAGYRFLATKVGRIGKVDHTGAFEADELMEFIDSQRSKFPGPERLPQSDAVAPYVMLAEEAHPLHLPHLMKPCVKKQYATFNRRLERARKTSECAFGMLYSNFRILGKAIVATVEVALIIVQCACVLHNAVSDLEGHERHLSQMEDPEMDTVQWERRGRPSNEARGVRDVFSSYFAKFPLRKC